MGRRIDIMSKDYSLTIKLQAEHDHNEQAYKKVMDYLFAQDWVQSVQLRGSAPKWFLRQDCRSPSQLMCNSQVRAAAKLLKVEHK